MAERRMFAKTIIDSDAFLEMPATTQLLYFHLSMRADDEGFINNPKTIMRSVGCKTDDMNVLIARKFIIPFESGVVVIKHWRIHNYIRNDRFKPTKYADEKASLTLDENNSYTVLGTKKLQEIPTLDTTGIPIDNQMDTQVRLGKDSIGNIKKENNIKEKKSESVKHKYGEYQHVLLTDEEYNKLNQEYPNAKELIKQMDEGIEMKGYKYKSHYLAIKKWAANAKNGNRPNTFQQQTSNPFLTKLMYEEVYDVSNIANDESETFEELRKRE